MTGPTPRPPFEQGARTFVTGLAYGFVAGAFVVSVIAWQYGNLPGTRSRDASRSVSREAPVDADFPVLAAAPGDPSGGAVPPAPSAEATIAPSASAAAGELSGRDLVLPVEGVSRDQLVRSYGDERSGDRQHEAIDILAPKGTPVKAVDDGVVARLFLSKAGGTTIYQFDPSERFCYYYAHLDRYAPDLKEGDRVRKGQVVGYVGVTGNAPKDTPHLHFAVFRLTDAKRWWEGTPLDPYDILR